MDRFKHQDLKLRPNVRKDDPNLEKYEKDLRGYYAQISNLDDNVGKIMNTLEETGKLDNTRAIVKDTWIYTHYLTKGPTQLFNLSEDPYQLNNRIEDSACTDKLLEMKENLRIKLLTHGDDFLERSQLYSSGNT